MSINILIASPSAERLGSWQQGLQGFATVTIASTFAALEEQMQESAPDLLLVDTELPALDGTEGVARLMKHNRITRLIALNPDVSDEKELALFRLGVRGCCRSDIDPQLLKSVAIAVVQGELWIRRTLTPQLLDELGARVRGEHENRRLSAARLVDLTRRELEIAKLIGSGETNKQIARQLAITERTVKAHLTEIFRKLGIADRLKLALLVLNSPEA